MATLITGGHGHIASWMTYLLAREGEDIILLDTNPVAPDYLNPVSKQLRFIQGDVMDFPFLAKVFQDHGKEIDGIIHTVGIMGPFVPLNPIATGIPRSVGEAVALSQKHSRFPVTVQIGPGALMPRCKALDITRAKEEFGYAPKYSLEDGVQNYAEWIARQMS